MTYSKQLAEAVQDACAADMFFRTGDEITFKVNIDEIIARVPHPEPVNARLLAASKSYRKALQAEGRSKRGHGFTPATREHERNLSIAWQEFNEAIDAAEQAKV